MMDALGICRPGLWDTVQALTEAGVAARAARIDRPDDGCDKPG
jgi:hypothetical protein